MLRSWRQRRGRSQLDLALEAGVSARHLSFIETGRSRPSAGLLLALADCLALPLNERNALLLSAGYAPRYSHTPLSDPAMHGVRNTLTRLLSKHEPFPGMVVDRLWNLVLRNEAADRLVCDLPVELIGPPANLFRICLHPDGLATQTSNLREWARYLLRQASRIAATCDDPRTHRLVDELSSYPTVAALDGWRRPAVVLEPQLMVPWRLTLDGVELSFCTTVTVFGTPLDITLADLGILLLYPADEATETALQAGNAP
jgi:transcriptional regulator with XRE-family HTH domain